EVLKRRVLGPSSEKMPNVLAGEIPASSVDFEAGLKKRRERAKAKLKLQTVVRHHSLPEAERRCPKCGSNAMTPLGEGKVSTLYEYQPARLGAYREVRETLRCKCGEGIVTAPGQPNWQEKSRYGVGFVAHVVTAKCADSIPLYRLEKEFARLGVPVSRSTMTDMFHAAADVLEPLSERLLPLGPPTHPLPPHQTPPNLQPHATAP